MKLVHYRLMQDIGRMEEGDLLVETIKDRKKWKKRKSRVCKRKGMAL